MSGFKNLKSEISALQAEFDFKAARQRLENASEQDLTLEEDKDGTDPEKSLVAHVWVTQQIALCTYKDVDLPPRDRFSYALEVLERIGLCDPDKAIEDGRTRSESLAETFALGGAIYKRKWEFDGQLEHLHQSLYFYRSAWVHAPDIDNGYGGVNAAYILDVFASRSRAVATRSGVKRGDSQETLEFESQARKLRLEVLRVLTTLVEHEPAKMDERWFLATLAELHFGLRNYDEAGELLARLAGMNPDEWEQQSTFKQLVSIARLQQYEPPPEGSPSDRWEPPWQALRNYLGRDTETALSCFRGKVGLALSGGGFRASLFHLGVLARLAEMGVLRSVEVLSTVSGGSIVGAHYYLELQELLTERADCDISTQCYVKLVKRVKQRFLVGVQKNIRMQVLASLDKNVAMIVGNSYSRSHRLGELYESELYSHIGDGDATQTPRHMDDLQIHPGGESFNPNKSNWRRRAKVPAILLNATTLNSGHNWQFTAKTMGEPPGTVGVEVDVNERHRRLWYSQAPNSELRNYRLGHAVAASSCVPGLFEPLVLENLYPGRTIRLVDGGVHDNQGVDALLAEGCTTILCSDASGQMNDLRRPSDTAAGVPLRANSILMDRVREAQYQDMQARVESRALQGLFFIHLKQGLDALPVDWIGCDDKTIVPGQFSATTEYGVDRDIQRRLAELRTDLDSFSEVEAHALMLSGYLMTEHQFKLLQSQHDRDGEVGTWGDYEVDAPRSEWRFLELEEIVRQPPDSSDARRQELERQLEAGSALLFRIWQLHSTLRKVSVVIAAGAAAGLAYLAAAMWRTPIIESSPTWGAALLVVLIFFVTAAFPILRWLRPQSALRGYGYKIALAVLGWTVANVHLRIFDKMFIKVGRLDRLLRLP